MSAEGDFARSVCCGLQTPRSVENDESVTNQKENSLERYNVKHDLSLNG